jgi:elongation factor P hydroxylase
LKDLLFPVKCSAIKQADDLVKLFHYCFAYTQNTILVGDAEEPIYKPSDHDCQYNQVIFTRDYFSSALHEIAHWCLAGTQRRTQIDYGYWYHPDGRDPHQQAQFEAVEVKPQALEYAFSLASNIVFRVSIDNLQGGQTSSEKFERAVEQQLVRFVQSGFNSRTQQFLEALHYFYATASLTTQQIPEHKKIDYGAQG